MAEKNTKRIEFFLRMLYALAALLALLGVLIQVGLIDGGTICCCASRSRDMVFVHCREQISPFFNSIRAITLIHWPGT